jgi:hypothetical protein
MYEILLEKGFDNTPLADISEASFTLDDQDKAIRSLMDESFVDVIECI